MPDTEDAADDPEEITPNQQWALIFNIFGQDKLREALWDSYAQVLDNESGRCVVEFRRGAALTITEHVQTLENQQDVTKPDFPDQ